VARGSRWTPQSWPWVLWGLAGFGLYLSLTAVAEVRQAWSFVFPEYIASPTLHREWFGRGRGPYLNPTANGLVLSVALCAALLLWPRLNRAGRLFLVAAIPVYLAGLYCTLTRSVWMGAAAGVLVVLTLSLPRSWRYGFVGASLLAVVIVSAASWERMMAFQRDRGISAQEVAESARLRPILATVAWKMFCDRPLLGCGFGQYDRAMVHYLHDRSWDLPLEKARRYVQHNTFLALLTEIGVIGMGLFALLLGLWAHDAWRLWNDPGVSRSAQQAGLLFLAALACYLPNAMFHDTTLAPMVTMLMCTLAGMVQGLVANAGHVEGF
jgi:O-antigen ligase